ncbi:MAG: ATP-dependent Clp protease adaptor ClpS [Myxococcales bacterium]|nr:ATP-dependent Clp protease adaptor ClpS [Myxococcales bacterium]
MAERFDSDDEGGVVTKTRPKTTPKLAKPKLYKVLVHNDNYTTREFVVEILVGVFHHSESDAVAIMMHVHQNGVGVAGVFTHEVAETKIAQVHNLARQYEFPLRLTMEPED